ncbi:hypothetical protein A3L11_08460 [Thermococcus siculi]|uniref:CRISPR-associated protein n=1 Tax=Thermococcus siculi TaxID=72803 RepID=A0A2Z2MRE9_9EURY|nr:CRISPR-associated CARF protein Csx1 [Thermococcus siculi]ASJ09257.1 hypothetical protein A3L11_08460 [Thermococcus siculi]
MGRERVLVATWGNPFQWRPIRYRVECDRLGLENCRDVEMKNMSTLPVLIEALKPDRAIILALDTLANIRIRRGDSTYEPDLEAKELSDYAEVRKDVEERVRWFIEERVKPLVKSEEVERELDRVEILVGPGLGEFDNASVSGDMLDFYGFTLFELSQRLPGGDAEVFLDLTHGINFMPVLAYRALKNLLGLSAYINEVSFHVLNSEPYPQGSPEWAREAVKKSVLHMRLVESSPVRPKPLYSLIPEKPEWSAFISSVTNGFPLAFVTFYPKIDEVRNEIKGRYSEFLDSIEVKMSEDEMGVRKVYIRRNSNLSEDFRTEIKLFYLLRVLNQKFRGYPKREATLDEMFEITRLLFRKMPRIGAVTCRQLEEMKAFERGETVYGEHGPYHRKGLIDRLSRGKYWGALGEIAREVSSKKGAPYSRAQDLVRMKASSGGGINKNVCLRNFIAHSGFEFNITHVRYDKTEGKVYWFYGDRELLMKLCIGALETRLDRLEELEKC